MTHDPFCFSDDDPYNCECDLIALVRADEREQAGIRIAALTPTYPEGENGVFVDRARAIDAALGVDDVWC
jgi:hypothetical protein